MVEADAKAEAAADLLPEVQGGEPAAVVDAGVGLQHLVVEPLDVEADHQLGGLEPGDELADPVLAEGLHPPLLEVEDGAGGDAHLVDLVPAAQLGRAADRLQVEEDRVVGALRQRRLLGLVGRSASRGARRTPTWRRCRHVRRRLRRRLTFPINRLRQPHCHH